MVRLASLSMVALSIALAAWPAVVRAEDLKDKATFDAQWKTLGWQLAERQVELAGNLDRAGFKREAVEELALAILADPEHKRAREKLGYKKDGNAWRGYPQVPPPSTEPLDEKLVKAREKNHDDAAKRIVAFAKRARVALPDEARRLASIACDFSPGEKTARDLVAACDPSFAGEAREGAWTSARERGIAEAFSKARAGASEGEAGKKDPLDDELEKRLDLGPLSRRVAPHVTLLVARRALSRDVARVARVAETTWAAWRYFLVGDSDGFSVEGEPRREVTGTARPSRARFLYASDEEYEKFCDKLLDEKGFREFAKKNLGGTHGVAALGSTTIVVYGDRQDPEYRCEGTSAEVVGWHVSLMVPPKAQFPSFLLEGLYRFFAGHASGRADECWVSAGATGERAPFVAGSFAEFRVRVRPVMLVTFAGELRSIFARSVNELDSEDSVRAYAFVDFLVARHRGEIQTFLSSLREDELPDKTLERVLKRDLDDVEREFREWARSEY